MASGSEYTQGHSAAVQRSHGGRNAANTCSYFTHLLKPDMIILDVGCGPGSITISLAAHVPQGKIIGVDSSKTVIDAAHSTPNRPSNCIFLEDSVLPRLPFEDGSFDVVTTSMLLCHIPDAAAAVAEMRRVAKPGGFVACRECIMSTALVHPPLPGILAWSRTMLKTVQHAMAGLELLGWARLAGFEDSKIEYSGGSIVYATPELRRWHGETYAARVSEDETWRKRVVQEGLLTEEDLGVIVRDWKAFAHAKDGVYNLPCGQVVCYK